MLSLGRRRPQDRLPRAADRGGRVSRRPRLVVQSGGVGGGTCTGSHQQEDLAESRGGALRHVSTCGQLPIPFRRTVAH